MIQMSMRDKERLRPHERPRAAPHVEPDFEFRDSPIGLHCSPRPALDRQAAMSERVEGKVVDHGRVTS